jgi:serine protease Do
MPQLPPGSPFEEFFDDFFKNRRGPNGPRGGGDTQPHKTNSLGSGFIIDPAGIVVTNNHVIADADEINVILNDGSKYKAEIVGRDKRSDLALLRFKSEKSLTAVKFGDSDALRHATATSIRGRMTTTSRPTPRSIAATLAARCSTSTAK